MFCSSSKRKIYNQITILIFSSLSILPKGRVASMHPNQKFRWLSNERSMIKDIYSKVRSSCQPKTKRKSKILGAICIIQKSRRKGFIELDKVSLELLGGRIENRHTMQRMYTCMWDLGLQEKRVSTVRTVSLKLLPDPQEFQNNVHCSYARELYRTPKDSKISGIPSTHLCVYSNTIVACVFWIYYKQAKWWISLQKIPERNEGD